MSEQFNEPQEPQAQQDPNALLHASGVQPSFTGLSLNAYRLEDQGCWSFGVVAAGAYCEIYRCKLGGFDDDLREAANPGFKAQRYEDAVKAGLYNTG